MSENYNPSADLPQTNTLALVSLISGIASWIFLPFLGSIVAVITGHMAKREISNSLGNQTGDGFATAGLILGYLNLGLGLLVLCLVLAVIAFGLSIPLCFIPWSSDYGTLLGMLGGF